MLGRMHRVLIVHRDADMREMLKTLLEGDGDEAFAVETADEVIQTHSPARFDLTILGWREAKRRSVSINNDDGACEVARPNPLLVLCSDAETQRELGPSVACEFIREPFTTGGFLEQVHRLVA
jgi:DNA-binding NtrC family response regulator